MSEKQLPPAKMTTQDRDKHLKSIDVQKIIEEMKPQMENALHQSLANERAAKEPIPDAVNYAFIGNTMEVDTSVGKIKLRKPVAGDILIFKLSNSLLYKAMMGDIVTNPKENKPLFEDEEFMFQLIYQFTHDGEEVYNQLSTDKDGYYRKVLKETAFKYNADDVGLLTQLILNNVGLAADARVSFDAPDVDNKKKQITSNKS